MTEFEMKVLGELKLGHARAIPAHLLAKRLGIKDDRRVRVAILSLLERGQPILSSVGSKKVKGKPSIKVPKGYFLAETRAEFVEYLETLLGRIKADCIRYKWTKRAGAKVLQPEQLKLALVTVGK